MTKSPTMIWPSAAAFGLLLFASAAGGQGYSSGERVDTTLSLDRGATLSVSVYAGRVSVVGVSGTQARIRGTVERGDLEITGRSSNLKVSTDPEGPSGGRADLDITVPVGTRVALEGFSAPFSIRGVKGEAKVESLSGGVEVTDAVGQVNVESVSGNVRVTNVDGDVRVEAVNGRVDLTAINGDIEGESVSSRFAINGGRSASVRVETVSGSIIYNGVFDPAGNYVFKSHSGRLTLGLPANAGATVSLQTFSGNVDSDFPVTLESGRSRMGHESRFEFRIGNGRARIVAETFSGDIRIQRGSTSDDRE